MVTALDFKEERHRYELDGDPVPSVSELLRFLSREFYGEIDKSQLEEAARKGTAVHRAAEELDRCGECEIEAQHAGYIEAYARFLREHKVKWELIEHPLADPIRRYAGTLDRRGTVDGVYCTLDIKTSHTIKKTLVKAQLNGYEGLCKANGLRKSDALYCLQLMDNGTYRLYLVSLDPTEFDCCLALHRAIKKRHGRMRIE